MNLVDLGTNVMSDIERTNPPVILSREDFRGQFESAGVFGAPAAATG
jgi:hypothetical protein